MKVKFIDCDFLFVGLFCLFVGRGFSKSQNNWNHPYGLLTPSYGIVNYNDLSYDEIEREVTPYDPNEDLGSLHWQCFPRNELEAKYESWRGRDGMGAWNRIYSMCYVEIDVRHGGELQIFVDRRAHRVGFCRDFMKAWKRLTRNQSIVCLNGDGGGFNVDKKNQKYKLWTWFKFKTKKGCYAYFDSDCQMKKSTPYPTKK